jgi:hypothetical protein
MIFWFLTLSNTIFLPHTYSPALIYFGQERGWWVTCNYPTVLKEKNINRNIKSTTCAICWLKSILREEKCGEQENNNVGLRPTLLLQIEVADKEHYVLPLLPTQTRARIVRKFSAALTVQQMRCTNCIQCAVQTVHNALYKLYTMRCTNCTQCAVQTVHNALYKLYTMRCINCTQCAVQTVYSADQKVVGAQGKTIIWRPFKPTLF